MLSGEFKFRRKDGSALWTRYTASPVFDEHGQHVSNLAMHTDVTERKRLEEELARKQAELTRLVRNAATAIYEIDFRSRRFLNVNVFYRVAQEALNNIAKRAGASAASVRLVLEDHKALLVVSDDGRGFDSCDVRPGRMGQRSMRERASEIGAVLKVDSTVGRGTTVVLEWSGEPEP